MLLSPHHVAICAGYPRAKRCYHLSLKREIIAENYRKERQSHKMDLRLPDGLHLERDERC